MAPRAEGSVQFSRDALTFECSGLPPPPQFGGRGVAQGEYEFHKQDFAEAHAAPQFRFPFPLSFSVSFFFNKQEFGY